MKPNINNAWPMAFTLLCIVIAGAFDYPAALATLANAGQYPDMPRSLHCPKHDARNVTLKHEVSHRGDSQQQWEIVCIYTEVK